MKRNLIAAYFSPTHTGKTVVLKIASVLSEKQGGGFKELDLTFPEARTKEYRFEPDDLLIFGFPVYAGRVPLVLEPLLKSMKGNGALAVAVGIYGNRAYEDALLECQNLLTESGFAVIAAGAFIGEHSLSVKLAKGRPDADDLRIAAGFAERIAAKIESGDRSAPEVKGNVPYRERKPSPEVRPSTADSCIGCMLCAMRCPMGIIGREDPRIVSGGCLYCSACVKACPVHAKVFEQPQMLALKERLETTFMDRKEPELFV